MKKERKVSTKPALKLTRRDKEICAQWLEAIEAAVKGPGDGQRALVRFIFSRTDHALEQRDVLRMLVSGRLDEFATWWGSRHG